MNSIAKLEDLYEAIEVKAKQSNRSRDWVTYNTLKQNISFIIDYLSVADEDERKEFIKNITIN